MGKNLQGAESESEPAGGGGVAVGGVGGAFRGGGTGGCGGVELGHRRFQSELTQGDRAFHWPTDADKLEEK